MGRNKQLSLQSLECRCMLAGDPSTPAAHFADGVQLHLETQAHYVPGLPILVRVEMRDQNGQILRDLWDAEIALSSENPGMPLSEDQLQLHNGLGSLLIVPDGGEPFTLSATYGQLRVSKQLEPITAPPRSIGGVLTEDITQLSGLVHVVDDLLVPSGKTLSLAPGTILMIEGQPRADGLGKEITVQGTLTSHGTQLEPIVFTARDSSAPWGAIDLQGGHASFDYTSIHRGGNSPRGGHTGTGPALRLRDDGSIELRRSNVTDIAGKIMQSSGGELVVQDSLWSRAVMGPEINNTSLQMDRSWIVEMAGRFRHDGDIDDNDGIYLHSQSAGQDIQLRGGVIANVQDDGIDTLGSVVLVEDYIIRDVVDKAVSVFDGETTLSHSLLVDADIGVETKGSGQSRPVTNIRQSTIANVNIGINAEDKDSPDPEVVISYDVVGSIIHVRDGGMAVRTEYDPADLHVNFSLLPTAWNAPGSGTGNVIADPMFVDPANRNFRLSVASAAIDAGNPNGVDVDGSIIDLGYFSTALATPGDLSANGMLNAADIDIVCHGLRNSRTDARLDVNHDRRISDEDLDHIVGDLLNTTAGDANLDGVFDSGDLVAVFQRGQYDDTLIGNSGWSQGDWNCDGEFTSSDLVLAFQLGAYRP